MADANFSIIGYLVLKVIGSNILFFFLSSIPYSIIALKFGRENQTEEQLNKNRRIFKGINVFFYIAFALYALFIASLVTGTHANNPTVNYALLIAAGAVFCIPYYTFINTNRKDPESKKYSNKLIYHSVVMVVCYFVGVFLFGR